MEKCHFFKPVKWRILQFSDADGTTTYTVSKRALNELIHALIDGGYNGGISGQDMLLHCMILTVG